MHRKKCLLADDPELAAAPADGKYYDGNGDDDHADHGDGKESDGAYMQKMCDVAEKAILAKKKLRKKCVNRDKM